MIYGVIQIGRRALRGRSPARVAGSPATAAGPGTRAIYMFQAMLAEAFFLMLSISITVIWCHWDDMNANGTAAMSIAIAGIAAFGLVVAGMRARAAEQALERVRVARGGRLSLRFNYRWQVLVIDTLEIAPVSSVRRP